MPLVSIAKIIRKTCCFLIIYLYLDFLSLVLVFFCKKVICSKKLRVLKVGFYCYYMGSEEKITRFRFIDAFDVSFL